MRFSLRFPLHFSLRRSLFAALFVAVSRFALVVPAWAQAAPPTSPAPTFDPKAWILPLNEEGTVAWDAEGDLAYRWTIESDSTAIRVTDDPLRLSDPGPVVVTAQGAKRKDVPGRDKTKRWYGILEFHGGPMDGKRVIVAERRLPLSGAANLRDIGGYRTESGKQVRWGRIYRAEALAALTDADLAYLSRLGLKTVCDFRGVSEAAAAPDRLPKTDGMTLINLPIEAGYGKKEMGQLFGVALKGTPAELDEMMAGFYCRTVDEHAKDVFGPLIARVADPSNLPFLYHCTAGKDRTGVATALILRTLGVPEKTVLADYSLTNLAYDSLMKQVRENKQLAAMGVSPERLGPLMGANPAWLEKTLRHIDEKYGSVEAYLTGPCGLDKATLEKLRTNLTE